MADGAVQLIVDELAASLGRSVVIDDPSFRLVAASAHFGDEDAVRLQTLLRREIRPANRQFVLSQGIARWSSVGRLEANGDLDAKARLCLPLRQQGLLLGYLWLIDPDRSLTEEQIRRALVAGRAAGAVLYRRLAATNQARGQEHALVADLVSEDASRADAAWRRAGDGRLLRHPDSVAVLVVDVRSRDRAGGDTADPAGGPGATESELDQVLTSHVHAAARDLGPSTLIRVRNGSAVIVVSASTRSMAAATPELGRRISSSVDRDRGPGACLVGVGPAGAGLEGVRSSYAHATEALRLGVLLPELGPVVEWCRAGVYPLLLRLLPASPSDTGYPDCVMRLLRNDPSGKLLATVEVYLDEAGDAQRAAARLHVHRTTLYYRLRKVEEIAAVDLDTGDDRLALHVGIRLARLAGALTGAGPARPDTCSDDEGVSPRCHSGVR